MIAIITAAGNGTRMQYSIPKQFIRVNGIPIYIYTIRKFINLVDKICLVIPIGYSVKIINELIEFNLPKTKIDLCIGGNSADESRRLGLTYMYNKYKPKHVIFHDAVRPGVSISLIKSVINTVKKSKNAVTTYINNNDCTWPNSLVKLLQTPQAFLCTEFLFASKEYNSGSPIQTWYDYYQKQPIFIKGSKENFKITDKQDLELFKKLQNGTNRTTI